MRPLANWVGCAGTAAATFALPLFAQSSRDSAGVLIVENSRPVWTDSERLWLASNPRLVIGNNADSAYRFRQVRGVMVLTDGRIAVADGGSFQLRIFSSQGQLLSVSAGKGTGPGQVPNMHWASRLHGDTIAIGSGLSRVSLYSSTGQFVRATALPSVAASAPGRPFLVLAVLSSTLGVVAPLPSPAPRSIGSRWTDSLPLRLVTESNDVRELGTFPFLEMEQVSSGPTPPWLSAGGVFAASDDRFYAGFGDRYAIRVYAADGKLQSIIRRSWTPVPVTSDDWEHWVIEWSKLWVKSTGAERERDIQKVREEPYADVLPAFAQLIVDRSGRLWVREAHWQDAIGAGSLGDIPAVPSTWSVFDVRGRWLGDVSMPTGFQPFEIGTDYVAGRMLTASVNQVEVYALRVRGR
jgi:hypothetical protein